MINKFYFEREESDKADMSLTYKTNSKSKKLEKIIKDVFNHQKAVFDIDEYDETPFTERSIADFFYKNDYYKIPNITKLDTHGNISDIDFINDVFFDRTKSNKNKLCFLLGDVGVGKTAFLNNIITNYVKYKIPENKIWIVRLDFEKSLREGYFNVQFMVNQLVEKSVRILRKRYYEYLSKGLKYRLSRLKHYKVSDLKNLTFEELNDVHNKQLVAFHKFIKLLYKELKYKLVIIIDNIDVVYHNSLKGLFQADDNSSIEGIQDLLYNYLHDNNLLGDLHANVLFVMRKDSYSFIRSKGTTSSKQFKESPYTIEPIDWNTVINLRYDMLRALIENHEKDFAEELLEMVDKIQTFLTEDNYRDVPLIEHIRKLTNFGLREMMEYLNKYCWISYLERIGINRLLRQYHVGLITFFLSGKKLYREGISGFPNIFLVKIHPNDNLPEKDLVAPMTYWLKYFIMKYAKNCHNKNEILGEEKIYSIFHEDDGYKLTLIKETLDSLSNANRANIIRVRKKYNQQKSVVKRIELTPRGEYIIDNLVFKFIYLQLIIDDNELRMPRLFHEQPYWDYFHINGNDSLDYSYILFDEEDYSIQSKKMIAKKGKGVLYFLYMLDASLKAEMSKFPKTYAKLKQFGVLPPDMEQVIANVIKELKAINNYLNFTSDIDAYVNSCGKYNENIFKYIINCYEDI